MPMVVCDDGFTLHFPYTAIGAARAHAVATCLGCRVADEVGRRKIQQPPYMPVLPPLGGPARAKPGPRLEGLY